MIASFLTPFLKRLGSLAGSDADTLTPPLGEELAYDMSDIYAVFQKPAADGAAATATAATKGNGVTGITGSFTNPFDFDLMVLGFTISPNAGLTAHDTDFATIAIATDDAADGAPSTAVQLSTTIALPGSGTWATDVPQIVNIGLGGTKGALLAAGQRLRPGANLFVAISKSGAGVVVPICTITVRLRRL
jgi:hypothetical protein